MCHIFCRSCNNNNNMHLILLLLLLRRLLLFRLKKSLFSGSHSKRSPNNVARSLLFLAIHPLKLNSSSSSSSFSYYHETAKKRIEKNLYPPSLRSVSLSIHLYTYIILFFNNNSSFETKILHPKNLLLLHIFSNLIVIIPSGSIFEQISLKKMSYAL